ncbi:MAG: protein kinase domain-containing protein [Bryobacteraceae bacterium]
MPMESGARLGQYEIAVKLGEGAMGEVYRARDTRLGRDVAIKILPAEFSQSPDRRRRFEQEWRSAAALAHANIVALYDAGDQDGVSYIVSELVEGEPLRDLIRRGPLPLRKALDLGAQIADGLCAAHAAGIVHRDLKPENIMVTRDGWAKILDFGLARYQPRATGAPQATMTVTQPGMVMGTVGYMSPEQVTGSPAGPQSDIFSLGIILYEMLTGKLAFERATSVETMSAILRDEPPDLPATVPPAVAQIVTRCLEKEPARRFQSSADLAFALRGAAAPSFASGAAPRLKAPRYRILPAAVVVLAVLLAFAVFALLTMPRGVDLESYRYTPLASESRHQDLPVWSPDGKSIAYAREVINAPNEIMVRNLDSLVPVLVARADAQSLFWSPDGARLDYVTDTGVWSMSRAGGEATLILKGHYGDAAPSPDGKALVLWLLSGEQHQKEPKLWISSPPGAPPRKYEPVLFEEQGSFSPVYLRFAPDGRKVLLAKPTAMGPELWLLPFPDGAAAHGKARRVFGSMLASAEWPPSFSWMPDSRHLVMSFPSPGLPQPQLWMAHVEDEDLDALTADETSKLHPAVSPDGTKIAYASMMQNFDIVEIPVAGGPVRPLIATSRDEMFPAWSPVAPLLAYVTDRSGPQEIWLRNAQDGSDRPLVTQRDFPDEDTLAFWTLAVSPDGSRVAYARNSTKHLGRIWISPLAGGTPVAVTKSDDFEFGPAWSPDGNWLTFFSSAGGLMKVRVGGTEPPVMLRENLCRNPAQWSPDGKWIACSVDGGVDLLSPDGKQTRKIGNRSSWVTWSADSRQLYALSQGEGTRWLLDSIDVSSGTEKTISDLGSQYMFSGTNGSSFALSLSNDHTSLAASVINYHSDIWMLEGFAQPRGWLGHLWPFGH